VSIEYRDLARDLKIKLSDPRKLLAALGISGRGNSTILFCCPVHNERNPSCAIRRGADGTCQVKCNGCGFSSDVFGLIAACRGLETKGTGWIQLLAEASDLAGLSEVATELRGGATAPVYERPAPLPVEPERGYPDPDELKALWRVCVAPGRDFEVSEYLERRKLDPKICPGRAIPLDAQVPRWAVSRGKSWVQSGHRYVLPAFDALGIWRSIRACAVIPTNPKRLTPSGHRANGIVLANPEAVKLLRAGPTQKPAQVTICEGESDFVGACIDWPQSAIIGVWSGSWSDDIARRIPDGSRVDVLTHPDAAGEGYAELIAKSLGARCQVWR
jgi:hypothetical protein